MDWTGGTHRRYASRGRDDTALQKQKAHFAKVRAVQPQEADMPEFLRKAVASRQYQPPMLSSQQSQAHYGQGGESQGSGTRSAVRSYHKTRYGSRAPERHASTQKSQYTNRSSIDSAVNSLDSDQAQHGRRIEPSQPQVVPSLSVKLSQEERLLLANRQRLLARSDWLGLAPTRPARINFTSTRDKERVGKRRKIDKSGNQTSRSAARRPMTPLFQERIMPFEPVMSGALPEEDFQIKIGTDAFASQTQNSRRSPTPANTSMRQPSTDFGTLSKESTLLSVDGYGFEILGGEQLLTAFGDISEMQMHIEHQLSHLDSPEHDMLTLSPASARQQSFRFPINQTDQCVGGNAVISDTRPYTRASVLSHDALFHQPSQVPDHRDEEHRIDKNEQSKFPEPEIHPGSTAQSSAHDTQGEDDELWKRLMHIKQVIASNASRAVLRSSSARATQATTSTWHSLKPVPKPARYDLDNPRGPVIGGGQGPEDRTRQHTTMKAAVIPIQATVTDMSDDCGSTSTSLRQIRNLAAIQPCETDQEQDIKVKENELWTTFVTGSQDSNSASSVHGRQLWAADTDLLSSARVSSSRTPSGLEQGWSDKVTIGNSTFDASNMSSLSHSGSTLSQHRATTSLIGHATTVNPEQDDIVDEIRPEESASQHPAGNIHTPSVSEPIPKRFRQRRRRETPLLSLKPSRFLPSIRTTATIDSRSVFDLPEND